MASATYARGNKPKGSRLVELSHPKEFTLVGWTAEIPNPNPVVGR